MTGVLLYRDGIEDCVVRDLSVNGAMISVANAPAQGSPATLEIARVGGFRGREKDVAGRGLRAEVAWRNKDQVGLRFTGRPHEIAETMAGLLPWAVLDPALYY
ncbi:MAG: PilZ domain-containing protein [Proteobacteria bacterium]|nr:PilZ domain-containing protein [Pseudomonadota bacterium]